MKRKKILITGVSSGFGLLSCVRLVEMGHEVLGTLRGGLTRARSIPELQPALATGRLTLFDVELVQPESFRPAMAFIASQWGGSLDVLINNAGFGILGPIERLSEEDLRNQMEVNFFGTVLFTQLTLPALRKTKGRILNVSSIAGLLSFPFYGIYSASKFALEGISEALLYELHPQGIQVGLIEPGGFHTSFTSSVRQAAHLGSEDAVYGDEKRAMDAVMKRRHQFTLPDPSRVVDLLVKLCHQRRIPFRTVIGRDAALLCFLRKMLPTNVLVRVLGWAMRRLTRAEKARSQSNKIGAPS